MKIGDFSEYFFFLFASQNTGEKIEINLEKLKIVNFNLICEFF